MVNFYHCFVPSAARIMQPLQQSLKLAGMSEQLLWNEEMISAFSLTGEALVNAIMLAHPQFDSPMAVTVDALGAAVGAILEQLVNYSWKPLAFFGRQPRSAQRKYSTLIVNCLLST